MDENKMIGGEKCECVMPGVCKCPHHKLGPAIIILIGLTFLFYAIGWFGMALTAYLWPILLVIYGVVKWVGGSCSCYRRHY